MGSMLILQVFVLRILSVCCDNNFVLSFDPKPNEARHTIDNWAKYTPHIPEAKEFTACSWVKIQYFALDVIPVWSYCTQSNNDDNENSKGFKCIQMYLSGDITSWNQRIQVAAWLKEKEIVVTADNFVHRKWNHICLSYSSISGLATIHVLSLIHI